ncbi:MAG: hypothetical protein HUU29_00090 [Planctomycetaceae bacterium]|nr:hypothetical protein [Planctomycetaceae bacterium]
MACVMDLMPPPEGMTAANADEGKRFAAYIAASPWLVIARGSSVDAARQALAHAREQGLRVDLMIFEDEDEFDSGAIVSAGSKYRHVVAVCPPDSGFDAEVQQALPTVPVIASAPETSRILEVLRHTPRCC